MKKDLKTDIENGKYKNNDIIASLIPYLFEGVGYSLQIDATPLLRKYICAAIYKYKKDADFEEILENMDNENFSDNDCWEMADILLYFKNEVAYVI